MAIHKTWYDTAQICHNGHIINGSYTASSERNRTFCPKCGKATMTICPQCGYSIEGDYREDGFNEIFDGPPLGPYSKVTSPIPSAPLCCSGCGHLFAWTEAALMAASELTDFEVDKADAAVVKANLLDIVQDTPRTKVAALKAKKVLDKAGPVVTGMFRDILVDIASETAKKILFP